MGNIKKFGFVCYLLAVLVSSNFLGSSALATEPRDLESFDITRPGQDAGPTEVSTAVWLLDIDSINSSAQNFIANAFIALRWKDPRLSHNDKIKRSYSVDEVWSPRIQIANEIGIVRRTLPEVVDVEPDGTASYMQRFVGPFSQPLVLNEFPFDSQTFQLHFLSSGSGPEDIVFLQDKTWIEDGVPKAAGISDDISLPDWKVESYDTFSEPYIISPHVNNAGYIFQFKASRDVRHYIWKVILPLLFIVMMSWGVFWIDPSNSGTQIAVATTSMLTLIAYRFAIDTQVPKVPYMTRLDDFMLVGTILVFLCLIQVIVTSRLFQGGRKELSRKIDRASRILFPIIFIAGLGMSLMG